MRKTDNFHLYEWNAQPGKGLETLHHKVASFGKSGPVVIGSFNLDAQSIFHNTESVILIDDL